MRFIFVLLCFAFSFAHAASSLPISFNFSGQLTDNSNDPILNKTVKLKIRLYDPGAGTCLLYEENQDVNTDSNGRFVIAVGSNVGDAKRDVSNDQGLTMSAVFQNTSPILPASSPNCSAGYTPTAGDGRNLQVTIVRIGTDPDINEALSPQLIRSVPYSMVADSAESLQGKHSTDFISVNATAPNALTQANVENVFTASNYAVLTALLNGTSTIYTKPAANGTLALPNVAAPATPAAGQIWYDAGSVKYYNGTSAVTLGGGSVTSITAGTGLAGGTITGAGTISLATTGVVASTYPKVTVDAYGRVTAGSTLAEADIPNLVTAGKVSGNAIDTGIIGGNTQVNTMGDLVTTGNISGTTVSSTSDYTRNLRVYEAVGNEYTLIRSPALAINLDFTLPSSMGAAGNLLMTDGAGNLSWTVPPAAGVTSFNTRTGAVVPATNDYSFAQLSGSVADGQLSNNVALRAQPNSFTSTNTFSQNAYFYAPTEFIGNGTASPVRLTSTGTSVPTLYGQRSQGDYANPTAVNGGDLLLTVEGRGHTGTAFGSGGYMRMTSTEPWSVGARGTQITFATTPTGTVGPNEVLRISNAGQLGVLNTNPSANVHIKAGTAAAGTAPLKLNAGPVLTTPEAGAIEFDGTNLYFTTSANTRQTISTGGGAASSVLAIDGSNTSPSMSFANESNLGFYRSNPTTLGFSSNGVLRFTMGNQGIISATNSGFLVNDGNTASMPAYTFNGDSNTGMYRAAADTVAFATNGTEKMRIDSGGNVGIGITAPARALHIGGAMRIAPSALPTTPAPGDLTFDSGDGNTLKYYNGITWVSLLGGTGTFAGVTSISNNVGNITLSPAASTGSVRIDSNTPSISTTSGALTVAGGVGVTGDINVGGSVGAAILSSTTGYISQLYGSSAASGSIRIDGTSNATKGNILLALGGGKVGIGTSSPTANFEIAKTDASTSSNTPMTLAKLTYQPTVAGTSDLRASSSNLEYTGNVSESGVLTGVDSSVSQNGIGSVATAIATRGTTQGLTTGGMGVAVGGKFSVIRSGSGSISNAVGVSGTVLNNNASGSVSNASGIETTVTNVSGSLTSASGLRATSVQSTGTSYGIRLDSIQATNTAYGFYVAALSGLSKYGIYIADTSASNFFGGAIGIGSVPDPTHIFEVQMPGSSNSPKGIFMLAQTGSNAMGGTVEIVGGYGEGTGNGGPLYLRGGEASNTGNGGEVLVLGGKAATTGVGGYATLKSGEGVTGPGGPVYIESGASISGSSGDINLVIGNGATRGKIVSNSQAFNLTATNPVLRAPSAGSALILDGNNGVQLGASGKAIKAMGGCTISNTNVTTSYTNFTCLGAPTSSVVVNCSHNSTSVVPVSCRGAGVSDMISCGHAVGLTATTLTCMWWQI